jgi:GTP-binding protein HflX
VTIQTERIAAAVLHPWHPGGQGRDLLRSVESSLEEAVSLTRAIDLDVVLAESIRLNHPTPATLMGSGAAEAIAAQITEKKIGLVVVDHSLTPVQQRNLEKLWQCKVIDRTGLILEIFGDRARTAEGKLQVEVAALEFQRSRLVRSWTHLERQRGGHGFLGGPGESQLEIDRRLIEDRIIRLKKDLEKVRQTRALQRDARVRNEVPLIALVGYTNAGKSTLFNRLTEAEVLVKDMLFATLDPTIRQIRLPSGRKAVMSDTVGFISNLPHQLVASFHATLEEVELADVILHVRDAASPDNEAQGHDVEKTLTDMGIDVRSDKRIIEVLNKIDLLPQEEQIPLLNPAKRGQHNSIGVSAVTGLGLSGLMTLIERKLNHDREILTLTLSPSDGANLAWLHRHGEVLKRKDAEDGSVQLTVALSEADAGRYRQKMQG